METQAPPNTGARLAPQAIEALIARRLDALGHSPDLLDRGAVAVLVADAAGSGRRLRSSLAATLFLASTEDAPQVDASLVHRALTPVRPVSNQPGPAAQAATTRPKWLKASRFYLVAGLAALAVSLTNLVVHPPATRPPPAAVQTPTPALEQLPKSPPAQQQPAKAPPDRPVPAKPPQESATAPATPPVLVPLPPAIVVRSPPVPASSLPTPLPAGLPPLPVAPPASIILLYPARDAAALDRLRPIALKLQNAGMADIRAKPVHAPPPRRVVSYFYSGDRPLADAIAKTLADSAWPRLNGNALQPSLVLPPPGLPGRIPGTVEVQLP